MSNPTSSLWRDVVRDLLYFRRTHLAVALGCAVASAVLGGALIVGDSVRASLRQITLERLGGVDHALAGSRFFGEGTADALAATDAFGESFGGAAPAILLRATAQHADTKARASDVGLQGIDGRFAQLYGADDPLADAASSIFPPVALDQSLATSLGAAVGDQVLISLRRWSEVPQGSLLSRDDTASVVETLRLEVVRVLPGEGLGSFGLQTHQSSRFNAFVRLADLQDALDQDGTVNSILVADADREPTREVAAARGASQDLATRLAGVLDLGDYGILVEELEPGVVLVESGEYVLSQGLEASLDAQTGTQPTLPLLTYLANAIRLADADADADDVHAADPVPYSTVSALDTTPDPAFGALTLVDGSPAPDLAEDEILLNAWTAEQLGLDPATAVGREVVLDYYEVGPREELIDASHTFTVAGIVAMDGLAVDDRLSQEYPGIAGSSNMSDWDPPFPIDLGLIRPVDEEYWDTYRSAPKAFVGLAQGKELWSTRWGNLTGYRVALGEDEGAEDAETFSASLLARLQPDAFGLQFQPVKALGLDAAAGPTDFGQLFLSMSFFVIVSAALLVALLFGLGVEQRASEVGLRLAVGFRQPAVRRLFLVEGLVLGAVGGLVGLAGAVGYGSLLMYGLRTWWQPAVGTSRLDLYVQPQTLVIGWISALVVVALTIWLTARRIGRLPTPQLLRGSVESPRSKRAGTLTKWTAALLLAVAVGGLVYAFATGRVDEPGIFFLVGPALLVGLLALFAMVIDMRMGGGLAKPGTGALARMAVLNSRRNRKRSLLSTTLIAFATFLVVTVAAFEESFQADDLGMESGAGGYDLVAESDVPLQQDLADPDGRFELGLPDALEDSLEGATIMPFRLRPGDDTSCLNLYKPGTPRILGVPSAQIERGGFTFTKTMDGLDAEDPWSLLDADLGPGIVPTIADGHSAQWILRVPVGGDVVVPSSRGEDVTLRIVATLATSVFQSELLISEERFLEHFPDQGGYPYFLIATEAATEAASEDRAAEAETVSTQLEAGLESYGFDAVSTAERLASFHAVQNTYLSTFRSLGGLGLLLGTIGLAVVLVRNVLERRGELATLRSFGYRKSILRGLIIAENAALLIAGLTIGTVAALLTAGPKVLSPGAEPPWMPILATLGAILAVGLVACWLAARGALAAELLPALKSEG